MSATVVNPLQASSTSSQELPQLELRILTNRVGIYPRPPANTTSDELAYSDMTTGPPNPTSPSDPTCLLSGPLGDFLLYSSRDHSQWLIDIAHDICDPALRRGSLQARDVAGEIWRNVNPTEPLTGSTYLYHVQAVVSLSKISKRAGKSITSAGDNASGSTIANLVKERDGQMCWVTRAYRPTTNCHVCPN